MSKVSSKVHLLTYLLHRSPEYVPESSQKIDQMLQTTESQKYSDRQTQMINEISPIAQAPSYQPSAIKYRK